MNVKMDIIDQKMYFQMQHNHALVGVKYQSMVHKHSTPAA